MLQKEFLRNLIAFKYLSADVLNLLLNQFSELQLLDPNVTMESWLKNHKGLTISESFYLSDRLMEILES